ncbi:MAG: motility associated factor glycosyltransferase family protein [Spirochaetales bacterium]|nr:motility associated factor glycosyltransferase family protein [Spirochaetales bacterium]
MSLINNNLALLFQSHPYLQEKLSGIQAAPAEAEITRDNNLTLKYQGQYLHSKYGPINEAQKLISQVEEDISLTLFFGFGLAYHIQAFVQQFPEKPFLIVEPEAPLFLKALSLMDYTRLFSRSNGYYFIDKQAEELIYLIEKLPSARLKIIKLRPLYLKNKDYYDKTEEVISQFLSKREVNLNTLKRFGRLWVSNLARNIDKIARFPGINLLAGCFKGIPALVVASGPSLDEILPRLEELRQRCVIISVDTSLRALLSHGIEPDFVVVADPQYWNTRHLEWTPSPHSFLISESATHPRVFRLMPNPCFFAGSFFPLGAHFEQAVGAKGKLGAGGSVATSAWDLARQLGSDEIYLAGLDLGFPDKKTHFKGAFFEQRFHCLSSRLNPQESMAFAYISDGSPYFTTANDGSQVLTDQRMDIYRWWFETQAKIHKRAQNYNLSEKGLKIQGIPVCNIDQILKKPSARPEIDEQLRQIRKLGYSPELTASNILTLKNQLHKLLSDLENLKSLARKAVKTTIQAKAALTLKGIPPHFLQQLDNIDKEIVGISSRNIAGFLLQEVIQRIMNTSPEKNAGAVLANSREIYGDIEKSADYHLVHLRKGLGFLE